MSSGLDSEQLALEGLGSVAWSSAPGSAESSVLHGASSVLERGSVASRLRGAPLSLRASAVRPKELSAALVLGGGSGELTARTGNSSGRGREKASEGSTPLPAVVEETPAVDAAVQAAWEAADRVLGGKQPRVLDAALILGLAGARRPEEVHAVDLSGQGLVDAVPEDVGLFAESLEEVNAGDNALPLSSLAPLLRVREVRLQCSCLAGVKIPAEVEVTAISASGAKVMRAAPFSQLQVLDLAYNSLQPKAVARLAALPRLRELDLSSNDLQALPSLQDMQKAVGKRRRRERRGDESGSGSGSGEEEVVFAQLEVLVLENNALSSMRGDVICSILSRFPKLRELNLAKTSVDRLADPVARGKRAVVAETAAQRSTAHFPALEWLSLAHTSLWDIDDLARLLSSAPALDEVILAATPLALDPTRAIEEQEEEGKEGGKEGGVEGGVEGGEEEEELVVDEITGEVLDVGRGRGRGEGDVGGDREGGVVGGGGKEEGGDGKVGGWEGGEEKGKEVGRGSGAGKGEVMHPTVVFAAAAAAASVVVAERSRLEVYGEDVGEGFVPKKVSKKSGSGEDVGGVALEGKLVHIVLGAGVSRFDGPTSKGALAMPMGRGQGDALSWMTAKTTKATGGFGAPAGLGLPRDRGRVARGGADGTGEGVRVPEEGGGAAARIRRAQKARRDKEKEAQRNSATHAYSAAGARAHERRKRKPPPTGGFCVAKLSSSSSSFQAPLSPTPTSASASALESLTLAPSHVFEEARRKKEIQERKEKESRRSRRSRRPHPMPSQPTLPSSASSKHRRSAGDLYHGVKLVTVDTAPLRHPPTPAQLAESSLRPVASSHQPAFLSSTAAPSSISSIPSFSPPRHHSPSAAPHSPSAPPRDLPSLSAIGTGRVFVDDTGRQGVVVVVAAPCGAKRSVKPLDSPGMVEGEEGEEGEEMEIEEKHALEQEASILSLQSPFPVSPPSPSPPPSLLSRAAAVKADGAPADPARAKAAAAALRRALHSLSSTSDTSTSSRSSPRSSQRHRTASTSGSGRRSGRKGGSRDGGAAYYPSRSSPIRPSSKPREREGFGAPSSSLLHGTRLSTPSSSTAHSPHHSIALPHSHSTSSPSKPFHSPPTKPSDTSSLVAAGHAALKSSLASPREREAAGHSRGRSVTQWSDSRPGTRGEFDAEF